MVSVFFADTVSAKARHTSTMTSIILACLLRKAGTARVNRRLRRYYLIVRLLPNVFALACRS